MGEPADLAVLSGMLCVCVKETPNRCLVLDTNVYKVLTGVVGVYRTNVTQKSTKKVHKQQKQQNKHWEEDVCARCNLKKNKTKNNHM